jgi:hypothetical protein
MPIRAELNTLPVIPGAMPSSAQFIIKNDGMEGLLPTNIAKQLLGVAGYTGSMGLRGVQGSQGTQGPQGVQGAQGAQGYQGVQGAGVQGIQGAQGAQGTQASQGAQGANGVQGAQGVQGARGAQGLQGVQGVKGSQGVQGPAAAAAASANTATNLAGGVAGSIPIQNGTSSTTFITTGSNGSILQYSGSTATWVSTSTLLVGKAEQVGITNATSSLGNWYLTIASGTSNYYPLNNSRD